MNYSRLKARVSGFINLSNFNNASTSFCRMSDCIPQPDIIKPSVIMTWFSSIILLVILYNITPQNGLSRLARIVPCRFLPSTYTVIRCGTPFAICKRCQLLTVWLYNQLPSGCTINSNGFNSLQLPLYPKSLQDASQVNCEAAQSIVLDAMPTTCNHPVYIECLW